ncbi:hypothetical protein [Streptomyces sp. NPDC048644]|uniref:hypothetical protein n=1 Tax=Streptomyces sp. NPDC048644 TaxID=3365582 RepID=UPI003720A859
MQKAAEDAKRAYEEAVAAHEAEAEKAADAKADADTKREAAREALDDARVAALREWSKVQHALADARKAREAADKALATARECVRVPGLTVLANNLPSKVVAGNTVDFSFTVANATDRTLNVDPLVFFRLVATNQYQHFMKVQWSNGPGWQELSREGSSHIASVKAMKPGARTDVKMRMAIAAGLRPTSHSPSSRAMPPTSTTRASSAR